MDYELVIIGAGPAGLTAGIYAGRARVKTLILEKALPGGELGLYSLIENYPGFPEGVNAQELASNIHKQAERFGAEIKTEEVLSLAQDKGKFIVKTKNHQYRAVAVIIATGASPRKLGVGGEAELTGKGVSYCATCDAPLYRNKVVAVIGGGNSALAEAIFLTRFASKVYLIHRRDQFRADKILQEEVGKNKKIETIMSARVESMNGAQFLESITLNLSQDQKRQLPLNGVFVMAGRVPATKFLNNLVSCDDDGQIITDEDMTSSVKGIFAVGDCRRKRTRQVIVSCGEGAVAAEGAKHYIDENLSI